MADDKKKAMEKINRAMSADRQQLSQLVQELHADEERLAAARARYSEVGKALEELNADVEERRRRAFALKMELQGKQGLQRSLKAPGPGERPENDQTTNSRMHMRLPFTLHVNFGGLDGVYSGFAVNISSGGMLLATTNPPPLGKRFAVEFELDSARTIRAPVEAMWVDAVTEPDDLGRTVSELGVQFLNLEPDDLSALRNFSEARIAELLDGADEE